MAQEILSTDPYLARFNAAKAALPGAAQSWLSELREQAAARFRELGFPTQRHESWKYTPLKALKDLTFKPAGETGQTASLDRVPTLLTESDSPLRATLVGGVFRADLSALDGLPAGATVEPLSALLEREPAALEPWLGQIATDRDQPLLALNTALFDDGLVIRLGKNVVLDSPLELTFLGPLSEEPTQLHPRVLILLDQGAEATLLEHHFGYGDAPVFHNGVSEIALGENARLTHLKLQSAPSGTFHFATTHVRQERDSSYESFALNHGGALSRLETRVKLIGTGADCHLNGAYLLRDRQHGDITTVIDHQVPHCTSKEVIKGALDDRARGVFQGLIRVAPDAQKSDGRMLNKTLLLSEKAEIDTKPELEIFADDVQCAHGATTGEIDHDAIFYLRSRGLPEARARSLMVESFLTETVEELSDESLRPLVLERIRDWLGTQGPQGEEQSA
ncbi:Fe-S cluster assembly protein SufD [Algihabitans albus]|uniref:Fe-S cluster assembly protein SufD n=1 Tax=Algihabitans albus TaxID=2164067 RepID=UPI0013C329F8|nr:Fe-S cluster assembly protein SufD [Algihabitans albus]